MVLKLLSKSKSYVFLALFLMWCFFCSGQTDAQKAGLKGKVKKVEQNTFGAMMSFGEVEKSGEDRESLMDIDIWKYDDQGQLVEKYWGTTGTLYAISKYQYNSKGKLIESAAYSSDDHGRLTAKYTYQYDDQSNRIEWIQS